MVMLAVRAWDRDWRHGEIDRRRPVPLAGHARNPRRHAAARPATRRRVFTSNELDPPDADALWLVGFNE
jgi:hypothetical protein